MLTKLKNVWAAIVQAATREPVQIAGAVAALIQFTSSQWLFLTVGQQGTLNAIVVALVGFIAAASVSEEKAVPALVGLVQALLSCALAFNVPWMTQTVESAVMMLITYGSALFVRTQVVARGGPPAGKHEAHVSRMRG